MARPINIDVSGLGAQFSLTQAQIDDLTELCVQAVTAGPCAGTGKQRGPAKLLPQTPAHETHSTKPAPSTSKILTLSTAAVSPSRLSLQGNYL